MIVVITGDVINSQYTDTKVWATRLNHFLKNWRSIPQMWKIYRSDEFKYNMDTIFWYFPAIKPRIKSQDNLQVEMVTDIGKENFSSDRMAERIEPYVNSGRLLRLKRTYDRLIVKSNQYFRNKISAL